MRTSELAQWLGGTWEGEERLDICGVASVEHAGRKDLAFAAGPKAAERAAGSLAGCLLVRPDFVNVTGRTIIRVPDPRGAFARVIARFHPPAPPVVGVHPSAVIGEGTVLGEGVSIGANCVIGRHVTIGACTVLHANVTVYDGCRIGARGVIHSGAVIGADGFGFVFHEGRYEKFPQVGHVEVGDDVEIGANTCIDRAALGTTSIGQGTKLDNMVHVGHNCMIGKHVVIAAQTGISGGVVIEDYAVIGGQVGIGDKARIQSKAVVGSGAGILTSKIVRAGEPVWGTPARPLREHLAQLAAMGRLPALRAMVESLMKRVDSLERRETVEESPEAVKAQRAGAAK
jgi:UDP-3-O-[3-hydroxymyristoyl] glucosamine N-acyltransferase